MESGENEPGDTPVNHRSRMPKASKKKTINVFIRDTFVGGVQLKFRMNKPILGVKMHMSKPAKNRRMPE